MPKSMAPIESRLAGMSPQVEADEREQQRERNRHGDDRARADVEQEEDRGRRPRAAMPRSRLSSTVLRRQRDQVAAGRRTGRSSRPSAARVGSALAVFASTPLSTICACSPVRIRMTPSTASFWSLKPNCPSRGAWPMTTWPTSLHEHRRAVLAPRATMLPMSSSVCRRGRGRARSRTGRPRSRSRRPRCRCSRRAPRRPPGPTRPRAGEPGRDRAAPGTASSGRRAPTGRRRPARPCRPSSSTQSWIDLELHRRSGRGSAGRSGRPARTGENSGATSGRDAVGQRRRRAAARTPAARAK